MDSDDTFSSSDESSEYEFCSQANKLERAGHKLPFDFKSLEAIILMLSDTFDFRVVMSNTKTRNALVMTAGLSFAGGLLGRQYGGKVGMALGGAAGGICALGIIAVSMRDVWEEIKYKVSELPDLVYDYLSGLGIEDYQAATAFLGCHEKERSQLAAIVVDMVSKTLNKQMLTGRALY